MISKEDLFRIVEEATEGEPGSVDMTSTSETVENWDSLGHLDILMRLSEHFGDGYVEDERLGTAASVEELLSILNEQ
jgi:acyl carrier protein